MGNVNRQVRILSGLHHGARSRVATDERFVIGSDASCSIVLCDKGVAARHCVITTDDYGITCRAIDAALEIEGRRVAQGEIVSIEDFQMLQCGPVTLSVGPEDGDWSGVEKSLQPRRASPLDAVRSLKTLHPLALFVSVLVGMTGLLGLAYAALSEGKMGANTTRVEKARQWLKTVAPTGSELQIGVENAQTASLLLSGYVPFGYQVTALATASKQTEFKPRVDVYATEEMSSSMSRLAQLASIPCEPEYRGNGQIACINAVASEAAATKLRMIARDVPGLRGLDVRVIPQPMVADAPAPVVAESAPVQLTQKFSVLISAKGRYLVGRYGKKYTEGDDFDGFRINRIGVDQVMFERDGREYEFYVAALGATR